MAKLFVKRVGSKDIPPVELVRGMHTQYNVCAETVGSEFLRMGVCHHDANMADLNWEVKGEEAFYVARGSIKLMWESDSGERNETILREGDQVFLPTGYRYTLRANGEPAVNVFAIAGGPTSVRNIVGAEMAERLTSAGNPVGTS
jgi:uncharacterized RmlC-like cupin family protein